MACQLVNQGGFPGARCTCDPHQVGFARMGKKGIQCRPSLGCAVLHMGKRARQGQPVACQYSLGQIHLNHSDVHYAFAAITALRMSFT